MLVIHSIFTVADDRAPTIEEVQRISEYPDRRIKGIVYTMASSGIRLGAWGFLQGDISNQSKGMSFIDI